MDDPKISVRCVHCQTMLKSLEEICSKCGSTENEYHMQIGDYIGLYDDISAEEFSETTNYNKFYLGILIVILILSPIMGYFIFYGIINIIYGWLISFIGTIVGVYAITKVVTKKKYDLKPKK